MTMGIQRKMIELEEGWTFIQKGITKLKNLLEGIPEQQFNSEEYLQLYTLIYKMCTQKPSHNYWLQLYDRYKDSLKDYLNTNVLPVIMEKHDEFMLRELVKRWNHYQLFVLWLRRFFIYLDQTMLPIRRLPALNEISLSYFQHLVYEEMKNKATEAVITLIHREREGGQIDRALLKNTLGIFVAIGMDCMDPYESDFEVAMLTDTAAYYSRKAASWIEEDSLPVYILKVEECLEREKERVGHYLRASSQPKLLEKVKSELLIQYKNQLLEKAHAGCHVLFRDDKMEDLSRVYRLFCMIPEVLPPFAAMFRQHVVDEGEALVEQAKAAARIKKDKKEERQDGQEQAFVRKMIELHDKCSQLVSKYFVDHWLFCKALKEAFDVFCNKDVAKSTTAELLATFCDNLLKKRGSERLGDEAIERTLDQVVKILAYINDKDLFAEFYQKKLCRRLLLDKSANDDHERSMLTMLKQQYGGLFTSKMEGTLTDLTLARENQAAFKEYQLDNSASNPGIDLSVTVLNSWFWPTKMSSDLAMPAEMVKCVEVFSDFYATKTEKRKLTWIYSLGTCTIIGRFDPKPIELVVTTYQAAVLQLFNEADRLSYAEIKGHLNLRDETIERVLHSLSCAKYKLLNKDPSTKTVTLTDSFEYNRKFTDKMKRITIPHPQSSDAKKVIEDVDKDRRYAVDASIVRIMKWRRVLTYQKLVGECVEQLGQMFKPDVKFIKRRIDDLINREYLERDKDDPNTFRYLT